VGRTLQRDCALAAAAAACSRRVRACAAVQFLPKPSTLNPVSKSCARRRSSSEDERRDKKKATKDNETREEKMARRLAKK
jgi:hypothetical protein